MLERGHKVVESLGSGGMGEISGARAALAPSPDLTTVALLPLGHNLVGRPFLETARSCFSGLSRPSTSPLEHSSGWEELTRPQWVTDGRMLKADESKIGTVVDPDLLPERFKRPGAQARKPGTFEIAFEPIEAALEMYFPDVPPGLREEHRYPMPLSDQSWSESAEPLANFVWTATSFCRAVETLSKPIKTSASGAVEAAKKGDARDYLTAMGSGARQHLSIRDDDSMVIEWNSTSLLASLATMALQDISRGLLRRCTACGRPFATSAYQAKYCSTRCREREVKRRHRQRKANGKAGSDLNDL